MADQPIQKLPQYEPRGHQVDRAACNQPCSRVSDQKNPTMKHFDMDAPSVDSHWPESTTTPNSHWECDRIGQWWHGETTRKSRCKN